MASQLFVIDGAEDLGHHSASLRLAFAGLERKTDCDAGTAPAFGWACGGDAAAECGDDIVLLQIDRGGEATRFDGENADRQTVVG